MTRPEALTILREARTLYTNISHLAHRHDLKAINRVAPITNANLLQVYSLDQLGTHPAGLIAQHYRWREVAWPLYHAIRKACIAYAPSDQNLLIEAVNILHDDASQIDRICILIRCCIMQLHSGRISWLTTSHC